MKHHRTKERVQTLEHWTMWKEKCALALCSADTQSALRTFAHTRFNKFAGVYANVTNTPDQNVLVPPPEEAWHCFETFLQLHNSREGKAYKEWLFARTGTDHFPTLDSIQGGATLLMRDVVRERLRREFSARWMVSIDAQVATAQGESTSAPGVHELLAGSFNTLQDVERREIEAICRSEAPVFLSQLSHRQRVALLARELGLSLALPAVTEAAACGKSMLFTAYRDALDSLAAYVRSTHSGEDNQTLAILTISMFEEVKKLIIEWGKSEKRCAGFFLIVGHDDENEKQHEHELSETQARKMAWRVETGRDAAGNSSS